MTSIFQSWAALKPEAHKKEVFRYWEIYHHDKLIVATFSSKRACKDAQQNLWSLDKLKRKLARSQTPASVAHQWPGAFVYFPDG